MLYLAKVILKNVLDAIASSKCGFKNFLVLIGFPTAKFYIVMLDAPCYCWLEKIICVCRDIPGDNNWKYYR